jgi:hypothetical protein
LFCWLRGWFWRLFSEIRFRMGAVMRRLWHLTVAVGIVWTLMGGAIPAWAATADAPTPTWQTNGRVLAVAYSGTTVYLAGSFTSVRPLVIRRAWGR